MHFDVGRTMKEPCPTPKLLWLIEYLITLFGGSWVVTAIIRSSYKEGPLAIIFVLPSCLACLFGVLTIYYCLRIFTAGTMGSRIWKAMALAMLSCIVAVPLCMWLEHAFWPPYSYGPGP